MDIREVRRKQQNEAIKTMAADDFQDVQLIRMKKYQVAQQFLERFLESESENIKQNYKQTENTFFTIKSETNCKNIQSIRQSFFRFEEKYRRAASQVQKLENSINEKNALR